MSKWLPSHLTFSNPTPKVVMRRSRHLVPMMVALALCTLTPGLKSAQAQVGSWTTKASMPTARQDPATAALDGKLYVAGGVLDSFLQTLEVYDAVSDTWTIKAPMPTARVGASAVTISGRIYAVGGQVASNGFCTPTLEVYDPVTDNWATKAPMPTARCYLAAAAIDGKLYAAGGTPNADSGLGLSTLEVYDPATDTWATKASMPTPRYILAGAAMEGKLYAVGGSNPAGLHQYVTLSALEAYDPATDTWTTRAPMPTARQVLVAAATGGKLYAIGGFSYQTGHFESTTESYDPATDTWETKTSMPTGRVESGADVIDGKIYVIGGFGNNTNLKTLEVFDPTTQDTTPPQVIVPPDISVSATSALGAVVYYGGASVSDDYDRNPTVTYSQAPGTLFPIGTTVLMVTARDASGNTALASFHITVVDTPPDLSLPGDLVTNAASASGSVVTYFASANDVVSGPEPIQCSPASGSIFPIGTTNVSCSATDGAGNIATGSFTVYVLTANQAYTPADGYGVTLQPANGPTLTFYYVSGAGVTTVTPIDAASVGTTPAGFALSNRAYQISTTAIFDDVVQLDFAVPGPISEADFNNLSILHNDNGNLVDITGGRSYDSQSHAGTITAFTYSFSPFYMVKKVRLRIAPLFDQAKAFTSGSTVPIKLQLLNEAGANVSSTMTAVRARNLVRLGTGTTSAVVNAGNANSDLNFRYTGGSYIFNLKTTGLLPGSYALSFYVGSDRSFFYTVKFEISKSGHDGPSKGPDGNSGDSDNR
jgi:N-acetylneuraminic acid mutarotase